VLLLLLLIVACLLVVVALSSGVLLSLLLFFVVVIALFDASNSQDCNSLLQKPTAMASCLLRRHPALNETCGRCPWFHHPWLSMVYSRQFAGAEVRLATRWVSTVSASFMPVRDS